MRVVHPSYGLAPAHEGGILGSGQRSRMGDFGDALTVQQLVDVVAFLQSTYEVMPPPAGP